MTQIRVDWAKRHEGRALQMILGLKNIAWAHSEGLSAKHGDHLIIQGENWSIIGEYACLATLEHLIPSPSLFPNGNRGMPIALARWRDHAATMAESETTPSSYLLMEGALIARQLTDGRDFLQGSEPSLADIHAASWMMEGRVRLLFADDPILLPWLIRMDAILAHKGTGTLTEPFLQISTDGPPASLTPAIGDTKNQAINGRLVYDYKGMMAVKDADGHVTIASEFTHSRSS